MIDIAIIGAGPGGMTAALYASRAGYRTVVFEKMTAGGQMGLTHLIENFPGIVKTTGFDLAMTLSNQIQNFKAELMSAEVLKIEKGEEAYQIVTSSETYQAKSIILALGASPRNLGVEGEIRLRGSGVSYCATCDGNFYRGADVAVVGGGNTAFEDALFLANLCRKVYLIHRREEFRAEKVLQQEVFAKSNIEVITNATVQDIEGKFEVEKILLQKDGESMELPVQGVFVAVGTVPNSGPVKDLVALDEYGYIVTDQNMKTSAEGVFAVGDVRNTVLRQIITACADGAIAAQSAERYVEKV